MEPITRLKKRIEICNKDKNLYETDVTGIANAILELAGKTFINGYVIKGEATLGSMGPSIPHSLSLTKPDIAVFSDTRDTVILEVVIESTNQIEKPVLVIECKTNKRAETITIDCCEKQLAKYMIAGEFPKGLILSEKIAFFYDLDSRGILPISDQQYDNLYNDVENVINFVRDIKI